MKRINDMERMLAIMPGAQRTRFHKKNYEEGICDALKWVMEQDLSPEMEVYAELLGEDNEGKLG